MLSYLFILSRELVLVRTHDPISVKQKQNLAWATQSIFITLPKQLPQDKLYF